MEVLHDTPFAASGGSILDIDGSIARVVVMKATFDIGRDGTLTVSEEQEPVQHAPVYRAEPGRSSLVADSDGAFHKPSTDVIVQGAVHAPGGRPASRCIATLKVGRVEKHVLVLGDRSWSYGRVMGAEISPPHPFVRMPLCWERAFGGRDDAASDPQAGWEPRNPVGTGFCSAASARLDGVALPNFEDPDAVITAWNDRPAPRGLGPVDRWWRPRVAYAGTYDDAWRRTRMPIAPRDFDYRFFQAAPEDQWHSPHLAGGEVVTGVNLSARGVEHFVVPRVSLLVHGISKGRTAEAAGVLDTILCRFDDAKVVLTWRARYSAAVNDPLDPVTATFRMMD